MALVNGYGDISQKAGFHGEKKLLAHAIHVEVLGKFGMPTPLPNNAGDKVKWQRSVSLPPALVPLAEGVAPSGTPFRYVDLEVSMSQYGAWIPTTDKITDLHENPVGQHMTEVLGEQAGLTYELLYWDTLTSGASVFYAGDVSARNQVVATLDKATIRKAVKLLNRNKARHVSTVQTSDQRYGTKAVEPGYIAVVHTDAKGVIRELPGFKHVSDYGQRKTVCDNEFGSFEELRIVCSPEFDALADAGGAAANVVSNSGTNADVYQMVIFGKDAWGKVEMRGNKKAGGPIKPIVRNPDNATKGDELGQTGSIGWKGWNASKILNQLWLTRIEFALPE